MMSADVRDQKTELSQRREVSHARPTSLAPSHVLRGFSLIEMVIVIAIIVLLFALTIGVITVLNRGSESRRTEDALTLLDNAYGEWKRQSERDATYGIDGTPPGVQYEIQMDITVDTPPGSADDHEATDEVLEIIHRNAAAKALLANLNAELLKPASAAHDDITIVDAWDTEVITVLPGRQWLQAIDQPAGTARDKDGTIRTPFEDVFGICRDARVRFVSAGPDRLFGTVDPVTGEPDAAAADNLYSYPLEKTP
jgi:prepilin-type N-terminal cleavage/methylation domain-containing protein